MGGIENIIKLNYKKMKTIKNILVLLLISAIFACQARQKTPDEINATQVSIYLRDNNIDSAIIFLNNFSETPHGYIYKAMCENLICNILNTPKYKDSIATTERLINDMEQNYQKVEDLDFHYADSLLQENNTSAESFRKKIIWHKKKIQTLQNN